MQAPTKLQMTSRGSLAYYLAAWVCGCFFMALAFWLEMQFSRSVSLQGTFQSVSFLGFCFFGLIFGAVPSLLFGWTLRRLMKLFHAEIIWIWIAAGAGLACLLIWSLGSLGHFLQNPRYASLLCIADLAVPGRRSVGHADRKSLGDAASGSRDSRNSLRGPRRV